VVEDGRGRAALRLSSIWRPVAHLRIQERDGDLKFIPITDDGILL
jgi:hypothetical protein